MIRGNDAGVLELWNTSPRQPPRELPLKEWGYTVAFSPDGRRVAGGSSQWVTVWDAITGDKVIEIPAHTGTVHTLAFHPDGDKLLSGSWDGSLRMWEIASGKELFRSGGGTRDYDSFSISSRGDLFATGTSFDSQIRLLNAKSGMQVATLTGATERVGVVAFTADGLHLVTGGESGEVVVWDVVKRTKRWSTRIGKGPIRSVAASNDNQWVAALSQSGTVAVWDSETGERSFSLEEPGTFCLRFTPDGRRLVGGGANGSLSFWTIDTGQRVCTLTGHRGRLFSMAFHPDGRQLATTGDAGAVFLWDAGPAFAGPIHPTPTTQ